jgi:hypothetical protein
MAQIGLQAATVVETTVNWAERLVRFLTNPLVAPFLLSIGFLGLIIEVKTPAFGLAGLAGISSLGLFFGSHLIIGLAGWEVVILLALGVILLAVEALVLPGFGVAGILGVAALAVSIVMSMIGRISHDRRHPARAARARRFGPPRLPGGLAAPPSSSPGPPRAEPLAPYLDDARGGVRVEPVSRPDLVGHRGHDRHRSPTLRHRSLRRRAGRRGLDRALGERGHADPDRERGGVPTRRGAGRRSWPARGQPRPPEPGD